ncbi:DUF4817 domain-containing protein [Trichonephila clavipes]|nr:DUF4817 domain-containing protein [Trichonephila clavipes]
MANAVSHRTIELTTRNPVYESNNISDTCYIETCRSNRETKMIPPFMVILTTGNLDCVQPGEESISKGMLSRIGHLQSPVMVSCQVIYSQFGLAIHPNDHQARRRFVEWAQNEIAVGPDFHKRISFSDEAHFWLNGYVNKQNCCIWSEANPQVYVETPLHLEKLTVWCALWAGGILLQKR